MAEISQQLADAIENRRRELGLTPTTLQRETGLSLQALKNIRKGQIRNYQERLTGPLCRALGWTPDSIEAILSGGSATLLESLPSEVGLNRLDERVAELERQVSQLSQLVDFLMKDVEADEHHDPAPASTRSDPSSA